MIDSAVNVAPRGNYTNGVDKILNVPRASIYTNGGFSVATGTGTIIPWDTVEYDTDGMWRTANPSRLTCTTAGTYLVVADTTWSASTVGIRLIQIIKNRALSTQVAYMSEQLTPNPSGFTDMQSSVKPVQMNAGDFIELQVTQNSGISLAFQASTPAARVNGFSACLISLP